jgi:hypothetical protein
MIILKHIPSNIAALLQVLTTHPRYSCGIIIHFSFIKQQTQTPLSTYCGHPRLCDYYDDFIGPTPLINIVLAWPLPDQY